MGVLNVVYYNEMHSMLLPAISLENNHTLQYNLDISRDGGADWFFNVGKKFDCTHLTKPKDISPKRSPQVVHTLLAWYFKGKDVVEAGTRVGDGLDCWARATNSSTGMEIDGRYCKAMITRAQSADYYPKFTMLCRSFFEGTPDADIYTFWAQPPHMTITRSFEHLALLYTQGKVRSNAEAVVLFEKGTADDTEYARWAPAYASWSVSVHFDEFAACFAIPGPSRHLCRRARGVFHIAAFPLRGLPV